MFWAGEYQHIADRFALPISRWELSNKFSAWSHRSLLFAGSYHKCPMSAPVILREGRANLNLLRRSLRSSQSRSLSPIALNALGKVFGAVLLILLLVCIVRLVLDKGVAKSASGRSCTPT
jgi:hypothetical protein